MRAGPNTTEIRSHPVSVQGVGDQGSGIRVNTILYYFPKIRHESAYGIGNSELGIGNSKKSLLPPELRNPNPES